MARSWPLNTWPKCAPPSGGRRPSLRAGPEGFHTFCNHHAAAEVAPPTGQTSRLTMAEGAERFRGLWEDEMFARLVSNENFA